MRETPAVAVDPRPMVDAVATEIARWQYTIRDERTLQRGIADALERAGFAVELEAVGCAEDRFDLRLAGGIVVEVKVAGSFSSAMIQCDRYLARAEVFGLVLVTSKPWGRQGAPPTEVRGKPFRIVPVQRVAF